MARSRSTVLAAIGVALATAACTVLSGVDEMELRKGGPVDPAAEASVAPGPDAGSDGPKVPDASDASTHTIADAACATPVACQEERCRKDLPDPRIDKQVGTSLGVTATCTAGPPFLIAPGPSHYYGADVRCTLEPQPTAAAVSGFVAKMNGDGWYGYSTKSEGAALVAVGQSTTHLCNTY